MVWAVPGGGAVVGEGRLHQSKSVSLFLLFLTFANTEGSGLGWDGWKAYFFAVKRI